MTDAAGAQLARTAIAHRDDPISLAALAAGLDGERQGDARSGGLRGGGTVERSGRALRYAPRMPSDAPGRSDPWWMEVIQLVPILCFAAPFIVRGDVDLAQAGVGFLVGSALFVAITAIVVAQGGVPSPILVGTGLWLVAGAVAWGLPFAALREPLERAQGFGLFAAVLAVGALTTWRSSQGFVGCRHPDRAFVRRASIALLGVAAAAAAWAFVFRADVRLGGGLPFIVLNVTRRLLLRRAPP